MRTTTLLLLTLLAASCQFSKGVKKDMATGLSASYNGFGVNDVYLADADGQRMKGNAVPLGSKLQVVASGIEHYEAEGGMAYPGCTILLTDKDQREVLHLPDAFAEQQGGWPLQEAAELTAQLNTGEPMQRGQTYHLKVRFFDKKRKDNEIISDVDLVMQ